MSYRFLATLFTAKLPRTVPKSPQTDKDGPKHPAEDARRTHQEYGSPGLSPLLQVAILGNHLRQARAALLPNWPCKPLQPTDAGIEHTHARRHCSTIDTLDALDFLPAKGCMADDCQHGQKNDLGNRQDDRRGLRAARKGSRSHLA